MQLTPIAGITLGKGQGKIQLQNQNSEAIKSGSADIISISFANTKTNISNPRTDKGTFEPFGNSKTDFRLTLNQDIEPNETIEVDFSVPITVKKGIEVVVTTKPTLEVNKAVEKAEKHPDSNYWWYGGK